MTDPTAFAPGEVVAGRFRIVRFLARGGMGELYEAEDLELHEQVALKRVLPTIAADERATEMFKREVHLARQVTDANVCRIYDVFRHRPAEGAAPPVLLLAMELLHGETLADRLKRQTRFAPEEALPLARQMAAGLLAAHRVGVVHRDFKSSNVMLVPAAAEGAPPRVVITDFGLARRRSDSEADRTRLSLSEGVAPSGTPAYMAPEQVEGGEATPATDVYALGVVLYEMITGVRPFVADTPLKTAIKRLQEPAPTPRAHVPALDRHWEATILHCLERQPADRFQSPADVIAALEGRTVVRGAGQARGVRWPVAAAALGLLLVLALGAWLSRGWLTRARAARVLTATDTVVLADFANSTGDPVFDDTLQQALATSLQQSPFLGIVPERRVRDTLRLMGHASGRALTGDVAQEVCLRTESTAVFAGSISSLGSQYVIGLSAVACQTGESMARDQVQAARKEEVLDALGRVASSLREKVGESLGSVQKYDTPLAQATTPSLEALKAFSLGTRMQLETGSAAAIPLFQRAIELDPEFAMAYAGLGIAYGNMGESALSLANLQKAYERRERISEREKLRVTAIYHTHVTGEVEKANQNYAVWIQAYPRDFLPHHNLGINYESLGQHQRALPETLEAVRLNPDSGLSQAQLVLKYCLLGRLAEARAAYDAAIARKLDYPYLHFNRYGVAFLEGDAAEMQRQAAWAEGKPGIEDVSLSSQADTEAFAGRVQKARALSRRAFESARAAGKKETAALWQLSAALREAEFGNQGLAAREAAAALALASTRDVQALAALALARSGERDRPRTMADELEERHPRNVRMTGYWLPAARAATELPLGRPARAVEALQAALPYELGVANPPIAVAATLYPVYLRGLAYLALEDGRAAAVEFQKFVDHRGVVVNHPLGALARLGLARAYSRQGDTTRARAAYEELLTIWTEADPELPLLAQVRSEHARLK
jgi:tetratricopeptide (TPR) repeat protein